MLETNEYIEKLIYIWCVEDGHYGLSLPNVIGAIRTNTPRKLFSIDDFFNEIEQVNLDIKIRYCPDLEEFVFGTFKVEDGPTKYYEKVSSLFYSKNEIEIIDYEDLISFFKKMYSNKIDKGLYSKDYYTKIWSGITEEDRRLHQKVAQ